MCEQTSPRDRLGLNGEPLTRHPSAIVLPTVVSTAVEVATQTVSFTTSDEPPPGSPRYNLS